jgi:Na+-translocating ferredoxin:NAD+ oxidoreductase RnfG subunit
MEWAQVLVIILAVFLALFLLLSTILVALLIKVTKQIKSVTGAAERTALKFEGVASNIAMFSSARSVTKFVSSFIKNFKK